MTTPDSNSCNIVIDRLYDAPVSAVWDAWADDKKAAKWWGPRGFTLTSHDKDLRSGGHWHYTMHGPDGVDYPNKTHYFEVENCSRLVYDHGANDEQPPMFRVDAMFSEVKGKTRLKMIMTFPTPEAAAEARRFIKQAGGETTWDRLGEYLIKEATGREIFMINRSFDVSQERMYALWTDPRLLSDWTGPAGSSIEFIRADIRPGGSSFYSMAMGPDARIYGRANYLQLQRPNLLYYTQQFVDQAEVIVRHPMAPTWPETMGTTVTFTDEGASKTRVTLVWEPIGKLRAEEIQTFVAGRSGMSGGWTGSFDRLEQYLARPS